MAQELSSNEEEYHPSKRLNPPLDHDTVVDSVIGNYYNYYNTAVVGGTSHCTTTIPAKISVFRTFVCQYNHSPLN